MGPTPPFDGHEDDIFARIASGDEMTAIARSFDRDPSQLYRWLKKPERIERYEDAQRISAYAIDDKIDGVLDELDEFDTDALNSAVVGRAKLRIDHLRAKQKRRNPDEFGEKQGPLIELTVGDLHLSALQAKGAVHLGHLAQANAERQQLLPAEIVDDEQDESA